MRARERQRGVRNRTPRRCACTAVIRAERTQISGGTATMARGPFNLGGLTVAELGKRVWSEINDDAAFDAAASLAYYFLLALFPLIIFLISLLATVHALALVATV